MLEVIGYTPAVDNLFSLKIILGFILGFIVIQTILLFWAFIWNVKKERQ